MNTRDRPAVLVVDRPGADRGALDAHLAERYRLIQATTVAAAREVLAGPDCPQLVLTAAALADGPGLQVLDAAMGCWPPVPVIYLVEPAAVGQAAVALKQGAVDYLVRGRADALRVNQVVVNALALAEAELVARQRARELGVLNVILAALNRELDEEPVLDTIVHEVQSLMGTDACSIILVDPEQDRLTLRASTRLPVRESVWAVPLSQSIAGRVVRERRGCITLDVTRDPDWHSLQVDDLVSTPVQSMITVPLLAGDDAIGVLQAINKRVGQFLPDDLTLMESIAAVATAAIVRGHQYAQLAALVAGQGDRPAQGA
jgi:FixJ family two-component response regulator